MLKTKKTTMNLQHSSTCNYYNTVKSVTHRDGSKQLLQLPNPLKGDESIIVSVNSKMNHNNLAIF